jgi:hypothetical protein
MKKGEPLALGKVRSHLSGYHLTRASIRFGEHYLRSISSRAEDLHLRYIRRHNDRDRDAKELARSSEPLGEVSGRVGDDPILELCGAEVLETVKCAS